MAKSGNVWQYLSDYGVWETMDAEYTKLHDRIVDQKMTQFAYDLSWDGTHFYHDEVDLLAMTKGRVSSALHLLDLWVGAILLDFVFPPLFTVVTLQGGSQGAAFGIFHYCMLVSVIVLLCLFGHGFCSSTFD